MFYIELLSRFIFTFILVVTIADFFELFLGKKNIKSKKLLTFALLLYYITSILMITYNTGFAFNLIVSISINFIAAFSYKTNIINKVFSSIIMMVIICAFEMLFPYIFSAITNTDVYELLEDETIFIILFCFARIIPFIIIRFIKINIKNEKLVLKNDKKLKNSEIVAITTMSIFFILIIYLIYMISIDISGIANFYLSITVLLISLMTVIFFYLYQRTIDLSENERMITMQNQQIAYYNDQYENLKTTLLELSKIKHDTKYILINTIAEVSETMTVQEKEQLYSSLSSKLDNLYLSGYKNYTNNSSLDMVINHHVVKAKEHNVEIEFKIDQNLNIKIDEKVLAIIFGNALDNAVEACVFYGEKLIKIGIFEYNNNLMIEIKNPYKGKLIFDNDLPLTIKDDKTIHGIGLKSIKSLVDNNDGLMLIDTANDMFTLKINLVNKKTIDI